MVASLALSLLGDHGLELGAILVINGNIKYSNRKVKKCERNFTLIRWKR